MKTWIESVRSGGAEDDYDCLKDLNLSKEKIKDYIQKGCKFLVQFVKENNISISEFFT